MEQQQTMDKTAVSPRVNVDILNVGIVPYFRRAISFVFIMGGEFQRGQHQY